MPRINLPQLQGEPLLNIGAHGKYDPSRRDHLSPTHIAHIRRTVTRVPEVMVKVLTRDSHRLSSVARHIDYISRYGDLALETDSGEQLHGKNISQRLTEDWDLDLEPRHAKAPKLVHKIMLSMPRGTPANGVLQAARTFAREQFALRHRYALVLHTDQPQPHVHITVKSMSEQGARLNIRKSTLREWRQEFARHLRDQGIPANATERAVRGQTRTTKHDGIYRAHERGASTHMHARRQAAATAAEDLTARNGRHNAGKRQLTHTREVVARGWRAVREVLIDQGHPELAAQVKDFVDHMPPPSTEREQLSAELAQRTKPPRSR
jgi:hypothetical protein